MADGTHIIQKQVLDITLDTDRDAYLVQEDVRRVYYERIVPMLDEVFSSLAGPDEIVRLDRLDLDLGRIARRDLEEEMVTQVRTQLEEILVPRLRAVAPAGDLAAEEAGVHRTTTARSRQAVFVAFVQTGRVPWWVADPAAYDPDAALAALLDETPEALIAALRSLAEPSVSLRLAHQMAPATLARLIRLAAPAAAEAILGVGRRVQVLHDARPFSPLSPDALRVILWSSAVEFVLTPARKFFRVASSHQPDSGAGRRNYVVRRDHRSTRGRSRKTGTAFGKSRRFVYADRMFFLCRLFSRVEPKTQS